jgi:hypothetical protein
MIIKINREPATYITSTYLSSASSSSSLFPVDGDEGNSSSEIFIAPEEDHSRDKYRLKIHF